MAIVPRLLRRSWVALLAFAGSMPATANASAHEMAGSGRSAVARGISTAERRAGSADGRACSSPSADKFVLPHGPAVQAGSQSGHCVHDSDPVRVESGAPACGARPDRGSTLRPGKRPRLRFDAEDWENRDDEDDDTDMPTGAWFRDMVRCVHVLVPPEGHSRSAGIAPPSSSPHWLQRLRC